MAMLGLRFCVRAFSSCGKWGPLFIAVHVPLTIADSLVAEHRLQTCRLSNCGSRAQSLRSMWDPPRPGLEPMSPALAGRFSTTAPPGKPWVFNFDKLVSIERKFFHGPDLTIMLGTDASKDLIPHQYFDQDCQFLSAPQLQVPQILSSLQQLHFFFHKPHFTECKALQQKGL